MGFVIGADTGNTFSALTNGKTFAVGDRLERHDGKEYVYIKASAAVAQYDTITFGADYSTLAQGVTTTNGVYGNLIAVAPVAFASGDYGWVQVKGPCTVNTAGAVVVNARVNTTATAGAIDDDATTGAKSILGMALTTAAGSATTAPAVLNYPSIGVTL